MAFSSGQRRGSHRRRPLGARAALYVPALDAQAILAVPDGVL